MIKFTEKTALTGIAIAFMIVVLHSFWEYSQMPIVLQSWETQKCVKVLSPDDNYSCENMPKRYIHEWVK